MRILAEGPGSQTIETDDGQIVVVPAGLVGAGAVPPPPGALPPSVLDFLGTPAAPAPQFAPGELAPPIAPPSVAPAGPQSLDLSAPGAVPAPPRVAAAGLVQAPPQAPTAAPAAVAAPALPTIAETAQQGAAALDEQQAAAAAASDIEARELAATGDLLRSGADRRAEIADEAQRRRVADLELLQKRTDDLSAMIEEQASTPIDPQRRFKSRTTGERLAIALGALFAGLGQGLMRQGGPNPVIEQIRADMENDIRAQMADRDDRARKIGLLGNQIDRYRTVASDRVALFNARMAEEMERTAKEVEATTATYGSEKARANGLAVAGQFRAKKAEYLAGAAQAQFANDLAGRKQTEEERHARKMERLQGWSIAENARQADQRLKHDRDRLLLDAAELEQKGRSAEAAALRASAEKAYELEIPGTKTAAGTPVLARSPAEAKTARDELVGLTTSTTAIDEMIRILETAGPGTNLAKNADWQKLQANAGAVISGINQTMLGGVLREGDIKFAEQKLLGGDLAGWQAIVRDALGTNATAGLRQTRKILHDRFNNRLRGQDKTAQPYETPPLTGLPPAQDTPSGQAVRRVAGGQTPDEIRKGGERGTLGQLLADSPGGLAARGLSEGLFGSSKGPEAADRIASEQAGTTLWSVSKDQEKELLGLGARAAGGDKEARQALFALGTSLERPGIAQGALFAAAEAGDLAMIDEIGKAAPKAVTGANARARGIAAAVQIAPLAQKAAAGDRDAQQALISLSQAQDKDLQGAAITALTGLLSAPQGR